MKSLRECISALMAGICIGLGGLVSLSIENRIVGSALFTIGLFCVCTFGLNLFTGKVCYALQNDKEYIVMLPVIWIGNLIGSGLTALCVLLTRNASSLCDRAAALCQIKLNDNYMSLFFLGVLCNILIYIAVEGFRNNSHELGKYISLLLGVMVFILSGTEHCVADMFYFWMAKAWSVKTVISLAVVSIGNVVGGIGIATLHKMIK